MLRRPFKQAGLLIKPQPPGQPGITKKRGKKMETATIKITKAMRQAYEMGQKAKEIYEHTETFWRDAVYGNLPVEFSAEEQELAADIAADQYNNTHDLDQLFREGFRNANFPEIATGWRWGEIPEIGKSYNFRDDYYESGVSMAYVEGLGDTSNKIYNIFNGGGKKTFLMGLMLSVKGSDGEPLMIACKKIEK